MYLSAYVCVCRKMYFCCMQASTASLGVIWFFCLLFRKLFSYQQIIRWSNLMPSHVVLTQATVGKLSFHHVWSWDEKKCNETCFVRCFSLAPICNGQSIYLFFWQCPACKNQQKNWSCPELPLNLLSVFVQARQETLLMQIVAGVLNSMPALWQRNVQRKPLFCLQVGETILQEHKWMLGLFIIDTWLVGWDVSYQLLCSGLFC